MQTQWYVYVLALLAGVVAGVINTLAGSGSLITLPMLIFLGLPANEANATNRVGVLLQNVVGIRTFQASGKLNVKGWLWLTVPAVLGSLVGAQIAVDLNEQIMNRVIGAVMIVMLLLILFDPQRWLRQRSEVKEGRPSLPLLIAFFAIGVYGGFIQAGVGIFILSALVLGASYNLVDANTIKLIIVLAFTIAAVAIFAANSQIHWGVGLLMAAGQSAGAWLAARFAARSKNANVWVRRLLIAVIVASIVKLFGLLPV